jgi:hypothetical protein
MLRNPTWDAVRRDDQGLSEIPRLVCCVTRSGMDDRGPIRDSPAGTFRHPYYTSHPDVSLKQASMQTLCTYLFEINADHVCNKFIMNYSIRIAFETHRLVCRVDRRGMDDRGPFEIPRSVCCVTRHGMQYDGMTEGRSRFPLLYVA